MERLKSVINGQVVAVARRNLLWESFSAYCLGTKVRVGAFKQTVDFLLDRMLKSRAAGIDPDHPHI